MPAIFISYRRSDSIDVTMRIYGRLVDCFGDGSVFVDVEDMPAGVSFPDHLKYELSRADVILVVIGRSWLFAEEDGEWRLWSSVDYVRMEIELALQSGKPVIPVSVMDTPLPKQQVLPESIRELALRHGAGVRSGSDFDRDVEVLCQMIRDVLDLPNADLTTEDRVELCREDLVFVKEWRVQKEIREAHDDYSRRLLAIEGAWKDKRRRCRVRYTWMSAARDPTWAGTAFWTLACLAVDAVLFIIGLDLIAGGEFVPWDRLVVEWLALDKGWMFIESLEPGTRLTVCLVLAGILFAHAICRVWYFRHKYHSYREAYQEYVSSRTAATRHYQDRLWRIQTGQFR